MNKITIQNNKTCNVILPDNPEGLFQLRQKLSFKMAGVEYTQAYKHGWDGITYMLDKKGNFPLGLLHKVEKFLKENNITYEVVDKRQQITLEEELDISDNLKTIGKNPRDYQLAIVEAALKNRKGIIRACTGSGKAQPLDAKVLTPNGWTFMKDIKKGSLVIGSDGKPKKVLEVFPQGEKEIFRVTFSDNSYTECCADHLWYTSTFNEKRTKAKGSVKTLREIQSSLLRYDGHRNHSIPMVKPIEFNHKSVELDPYFLGLLLGDGGLSVSSQVSITSIDDEIVNYCKNIIPKHMKLQKSKITYYFSKKKKGGRNPIIDSLRKYDLMGKKSIKKFIPQDYLFNSIDVRLKVLQGLMDTDGFCSSNGMSNVFYTSSEQLAKDVQFLVQSFGGKAIITNKNTTYTYKDILQGKQSFAVHISLPENVIPFNLDRKISRYKERSKYKPTRLIDKIESVGKKEAQCILIDSEDHLYVTDDFILTHNTLAASLITAKFNKTTIIYVIGLDLLQQFHKTFSEVLKQPIGFIGNGVCDIQKINIASVWTVGKALNIKFKMFEDDESEEEEDLNVSNKMKIQQLLKATQLHIFDECHSVSCDTIKEIYKNIDPVLIYGMSGTPYRDDGSDLLIDGMLGEQIINVSASDLIDREILAQPIIKFINVPALPVHARTYADVYGEYVVDNEARNYLVLKETQKMVEKGYQVLVLFKQIRHGKMLHKLFKENGVNCDILHGAHKLKHREEIKEQLMSKKLDVVLASVVFDIGVDIPSLSGLVLAGSGRSSVKALQRIGRVIRSHPGKTYAAIVDFVDNVRFLKNHSQTRYKIYTSEKGFIVKWPKESYS